MPVPSRFAWLVAAALLGVTSTSTARAAPDEPPPAAKEPSPADREKSRAAFRKGVARARASDWGGARASFEEAWSLVQHPSILLNLGIARLRTDDPVLAEQDLVRFLSDDTGAQPDEITSAREALTEARSKIGTLRIAATPATSRVSVDGKVVDARVAEGSAAEEKVKAGKHVVVVEAEGFVRDQREVDVPAKADTEVKVVLSASGAAAANAEPGASGFPLRRVAGWSLVGLGGVALIASGVMAVDALGDANDYNDPKSKSFQNQDLKSQGIALRTGADVAFLVALLAGAGAYVLLFTDVGAVNVRPPSLHW